jgi:hypothetical protein
MATSVIFPKLPKGKNHPKGENASNLVTLRGREGDRKRKSPT